MVLSYCITFFIIALGVMLSIHAKKLTPAAAITGGMFAAVIFFTTGVTGILLLAAFFVMGVAATTHQRKTKHQRGLTDNVKGERTTQQVLANSGVAVIICLLILFRQLGPHTGLLMIAGSFAAAAADTVSSELGNVYGHRFYDILSFKKVTRGVNGAISLEGSLAGIAASFLIALIYLISNGWVTVYIFVIAVAGTIGNIADSILGTTLENKRLLTNNAVNFINTGVGAVTSLILHKVLSS